MDLLTASDHCAKVAEGRTRNVVRRRLSVPRRSKLKNKREKKKELILLPEWQEVGAGGTPGPTEECPSWKMAIHPSLMQPKSEAISVHFSPKRDGRQHRVLTPIRSLSSPAHDSRLSEYFDFILYRTDAECIRKPRSANFCLRVGMRCEHHVPQV